MLYKWIILEVILRRVIQVKYTFIVVNFNALHKSTQGQPADGKHKC